MKKALATFAILVVMVAGVISISGFKFGGKPPINPLIDCQHTQWVDEVDSGVKSLGDGTNFRAHLYALRDSTSNSYCGELRVRTAWNMPATVCHTFTSQLYKSPSTLIGGTTSPQHCGDVSSWDFIKVESSGTYFGLSDCDLAGATETPTWTIN